MQCFAIYNYTYFRNREGVANVLFYDNFLCCIRVVSGHYNHIDSGGMYIYPGRICQFLSIVFINCPVMLYRCMVCMSDAEVIMMSFPCV